MSSYSSKYTCLQGLRFIIHVAGPRRGLATETCIWRPRAGQPHWEFRNDPNIFKHAEAISVHISAGIHYIVQAYLNHQSSKCIVPAYTPNDKRFSWDYLPSLPHYHDTKKSLKRGYLLCCTAMCRHVCLFVNCLK